MQASNSSRAATSSQNFTQQELYEWFKRADRDQSGRVDENELQQLLTLSPTEPFSMAAIRLMIRMFDLSHTNRIGFEEFCSLWKYLHEWKQVFDRFDADGTARLDPQEMQSALTAFGYRVSPRLLTVLVNKFDRTGASASIRFDDFIQCCVVLQSLTGRFQKFDAQQNGVATFTYEDFLLTVMPFVA